MRSLFSLSEDESDDGIFACMRRLNNFIQVLAPKISKTLQQLQITSENFAIGWVTSIFC